MGTILSSRRHEPGKVLVEVVLDQAEYCQLHGEMDDVHLFSSHMQGVPSKVSLRGRNDSTKYLLIPRQLRKKLPIYGGVTCQRIDHGGKYLFIYVLDPAREQHSRIVE